jgi:hypothetical protein
MLAAAVPVCYPTSCSDLNRSVEHGSYLPLTGHTGTTSLLRCEAGYSVSGSEYVTCTGSLESNGLDWQPGTHEAFCMFRGTLPGSRSGGGQSDHKSRRLLSFWDSDLSSPDTFVSSGSTWGFDNVTIGTDVLTFKALSPYTIDFTWSVQNASKYDVIMQGAYFLYMQFAAQLVFPGEEAEISTQVEFLGLQQSINKLAMLNQNATSLIADRGQILEGITS